MIVYGDPQFEKKWGALAARLSRRLARIVAADGPPSLDAARAVLIEAGQLEQACEDAADRFPPEFRVQIRELTDALARLFYRRWAGETIPDGTLREIARASGCLENAAEFARVRVTVKLPEGFAFYALYPGQYCAAAVRWAAEQREKSPVLVVGIRSIGTTLSAVVCAALRALGWDPRRVTVRPGGHPFSREAELPRGCATAELAAAGWALVVDEGPGLSGSSMAAAAQACIRAGFAPERIVFFPGHAGEPGGAASPETRALWRAVPRRVVAQRDLRWANGIGGADLFGMLATRAARVLRQPVVRVENMSGGEWRRVCFENESDWPEVCAEWERQKIRCVAANGDAVLWKFAGLAPAPPRISASAEACSSVLRRRHRDGWTPAPVGTCLGFVGTRWIAGAPLRADDLTDALLRRIGGYVCAVAGAPLARAEERAARLRLAGMLEQNTRESLGDSAAERARDCAARVANAAGDSPRQPASGDGWLAPREWVRAAADGRIWKTGSTGHDADHTVLGRQPVAWDVAGVLVEWRCGAREISTLLNIVQRELRIQIPPAVLDFHRAAYAAFHLGRVSLSANSAACPPAEKQRLEAAIARYRGELARSLGVGETASANVGAAPRGAA